MRQLGPALRRQIRRKRNLELPRDRGVAPALGLLGSVPEQMPIPRPLGGVVGHDQDNICTTFNKFFYNI